MRSFFQQEAFDRASDLIRAGATTGDVAARVGVTRRTVERWRHELAGDQPRRESRRMRMYNELRTRAVAMREGGMSCYAIGKELGLSHKTVWRWVQ